MDLYNAEKYANMCNNPLIQQHWSLPQWGDYIYVEGHGRVVLGFDWLRVGKYLDSRRHVKFAMSPEITAMHVDKDVLPDSVCIMSGEYRVVTIPSPIWQPKVEQILDMFRTHEYGIGGILKGFADDAYGYGSDAGAYTYYRQFDHIEQKLLAYFMKLINRLYWMESEQGWFTLEQCKRIYK
jgi:hypothetical protein